MLSLYMLHIILCFMFQRKTEILCPSSDYESNKTSDSWLPSQSYWIRISGAGAWNLHFNKFCWWFVSIPESWNYWCWGSLEDQWWVFSHAPSIFFPSVLRYSLHYVGLYSLHVGLKNVLSVCQESEAGVKLIQGWRWKTTAPSSKISF